MQFLNKAKVTKNTISEKVTLEHWGADATTYNFVVHRCGDDGVGRSSQL